MTKYDADYGKYLESGKCPYCHELIKGNKDSWVCELCKVAGGTVAWDNRPAMWKESSKENR